MRYRFQPWQLALLVILLCTAAVVLIHQHRVSRSYGAADLVELLPAERAAHVYIDVALLRNTGILDLLAGSKAAEEPDYRRFANEIGFDYRTDLDAVAAAFLHGDEYFTLRGRFDWRRLNAYAESQGGSCRNAICTMPASTPERHISFYPVKSNIMALAVSKDERGTDMIGLGQWKSAPRLPGEPVWVSVPSYMFSDVSSLPAGTHAFLTPLAQAQEITFAVGPAGQGLQIRLEVACSSPDAAADLTRQLSSTTDLLKKMIERQHMTPNPKDLSGVLVAGVFAQQDRKVNGTWPLDRGFVEALASGEVQ